jgi:predicted RNase H-like HicB family nuclease
VNAFFHGVMSGSAKRQERPLEWIARKSGKLLSSERQVYYHPNASLLSLFVQFPNINGIRKETAMAHKVSIVIEKDEHGYHAYSPELEGCQTQGDSLEETIENAREAVALYLETLPGDEIKELLSKEILTATIE